MKWLKQLNFILGALLAFVLLVGAWQLTAVASDEPAQAAGWVEPQKSDIPGIYNFTQVGQTVAFGGATQPSAMASLKERGYGSVINMRLANETGVNIEAARSAAEAAGLEYIHIPFNSSDPDPQLMDRFLAAIGNSDNQPPYVHCGSATRVAALWMIKRVQQDGWPIDAASKEAEMIAGKPQQAIAYATRYLSSDSR